MATWNGKPKKFKIEFVNKNPNIWDLSYDEVEFSWNYSTSADCLEVIYSHPELKGSPKSTLYGPDHAQALLYTLASWMATYEGRDNLKELLKDLLEEEE